MKQESAFVISEFTNPSGVIVFRVSGWLDGKRMRKNFPTCSEAESEALFCRIDGQPLARSFYVKRALTNYRTPVAQKLFMEAVTEFLVIKDHERNQDLLSKP